MEQMTHDRRSIGGLGFAVLSAASFGTSGALAAGLMDAGWSAAAAVAVRVSLAALVLLVPALSVLDGRWLLLREEWRTVVAYGLVAVAGCQLAYFNAVRHMEVGPALLIEYTAPVAVLLWAWVRHGQRPGWLTVAGSVLAAAGLVLVLDLVGGADVSPTGVLWSLGAMVGAAVYFILSAGESELPPLVLAAGGLVVGAVALAVAGLLGVLDFSATSRDVDYAGAVVPFWLPLVVLGIVSAAVAYVAGIAASRRLGSRLASFVALLEVVFALVFAWLLLRELPGAVQFAGAALVLAGVVVVKLGERSVPVLVEGDVAAGTETPQLV
ncbi:drug/metabolite transporter (DMT)-like permease [Marmoricola sp. OAE513]|uniref:EamA family transporter n=1 Tax=Marmoricola sp. OAE513 TaxID=2817894 RepID=UPI001E089123